MDHRHEHRRGILPHDIDDPAILASLLSRLSSVSTQNLVVDCDEPKTVCGINVAVDDLKTLLYSERRPAITRWINFFGWSGDQKDAIQAISAKYKLSRRLMDLLWPHTTDSGQQQPGPACISKNDGDIGLSELDLESALRAKVKTSSAPAAAHPSKSLPNFEQIIKSLWHFCSVDWGQHYLYIGYNSLFPIESSHSSTHQDPNKPPGQRIWTSLLLCDDGTVISVFENPSFTETRSHEQILFAVRQNVINIFRNLSKLHASTSSDDSLGRISIRPVIGDRSNGPVGLGTPTSSLKESSALLLYYLFDDWSPTYSRLTRSKDSYRVKLEEIRKDMFQYADVHLVERLHVVGHQLTVLKNVYRSYQLIMKRVLHRQYRGGGGSSGSNAYRGFPVSMDTMSAGENEDDTDSACSIKHHIALPPSTIFRFERLLDRIELLAQTEIEECIAEKASLTFMNFNLIALAESQAVETLTRTTVLLAKATILFLPVSLMTGYFSVQLPEIQQIYSLKTYWLCFLVVAVLTVFVLLVSGIAKAKVKGQSGYRGFTRILWDWTQGGARRKRKTEGS